MRNLNKKPNLINLDDFLPVNEDIKKREMEFVLHVIENTELDFSDEDLIYVITNQDFLLILSVLVREYETFRQRNPSDK